MSDSIDKTWSASSSVWTSNYGNTVGTWTNEYSGSTEIHSHSEADYQTKKNWLTDSSGSTWTASSGGSSSSYLEKTTQNNSKYSWDWTLTESNHTKTDVGYSGYGSYDQTKDSWNSGYSGKSSSDGSSTMTNSSGGSQAHDWKYHYGSSDAWTETWSYGSTSGSASGSGSGGGYTNTTSGGSSSSWGSSGSSFNSWSSSWSYSTPANVLSGSGSGVTSGSGASTGSGGAYGGGGSGNTPSAYEAPTNAGTPTTPFSSTTTEQDTPVRRPRMSELQYCDVTIPAGTGTGGGSEIVANRQGSIVSGRSWLQRVGDTFMYFVSGNLSDSIAESLERRGYTVTRPGVREPVVQPKTTPVDNGSYIEVEIGDGNRIRAYYNQPGQNSTELDFRKTQAFQTVELARKQGGLEQLHSNIENGRLAAGVAVSIVLPGDEVVDFMEAASRGDVKGMALAGGGAIIPGLNKLDEVAPAANKIEDALPGVNKLDDTPAGPLFGQKRVGPTFGTKGRPLELAGRAISDVAADLRAGRMSPDQLPIEAFKLPDGRLVSANTRSLAALSEAGFKPTKITIIEPTQELLARLRETPIIPNAPLPGPRVPVTPIQSDLTVLGVIELPK